MTLEPCRAPQAGDLPQERVFKGPNGLTIRTSFFWPAPPEGPSAGYTAPLARWTETIIEGLTSEPVVLRSDFSQTYAPFHHNFVEDYIFDPWLEGGLPAARKEELVAANVRWIHVVDDRSTSRITVLGLDGTFRVLNGGN